MEGVRDDQPFRFPASRVVMATPLHRVAQVLDMGEEAASAAAAIPYYPLALINADYDADVFTPDMNSIMFNAASPLGHCSANRMYKPHSVRFTLSGRTARQILTLDDDTLVATAEEAFRRVHPINGRRLFAHVQRHLGGICAYGFNYSITRKRLLTVLARTRGCALAGDYLFGHNMEGCLQSAMAAIRHLTGEDGSYRRHHEYPAALTATASEQMAEAS